MTPREANADLLAEITALRDRVASLTRKNAELEGTLGQASHREAATSEILRVISNSPSDLQPIFDAIRPALATDAGRFSSRRHHRWPIASTPIVAARAGLQVVSAVRTQTPPSSCAPPR
jgi:hypothetical protein